MAIDRLLTGGRDGLELRLRCWVVQAMAARVEPDLVVWGSVIPSELGFEVRTGQVLFPGNGKATALGDDKGFAKTVWHERSGELLGAHLAGPEVTDLIQGFVIAKRAEATADDPFDTTFPNPTLSEAMRDAVLAAYGRALEP